MFDLLVKTHLINHLENIVIIDPRKQFSSHFKDFIKKYNRSREKHTDVCYYFSEKEMDYKIFCNIREKNLNQFNKSKSKNVHNWREESSFSQISQSSELNSNKITKFVSHYCRFMSSNTRKI